jgi:hypothetical protein
LRVALAQGPCNSDYLFCIQSIASKSKEEPEDFSDRDNADADAEAKEAADGREEVDPRLEAIL